VRERLTAFAEFRAAVLDDPSLQERLRGIADWQTFVAEAIAAAAERGVELTPELLEDERRREHLAWLTRAV
jgi:Nif11 domain